MTTRMQTPNIIQFYDIQLTEKQDRMLNTTMHIALHGKDMIVTFAAYCPDPVAVDALQWIGYFVVNVSNPGLH